MEVRSTTIFGRFGFGLIWWSELILRSPFEGGLGFLTSFTKRTSDSSSLVTSSWSSAYFCFFGWGRHARPTHDFLLSTYTPFFYLSLHSARSLFGICRYSCIESSWEPWQFGDRILSAHQQVFCWACSTLSSRRRTAQQSGGECHYVPCRSWPSLGSQLPEDARIGSVLGGHSAWCTSPTYSSESSTSSLRNSWSSSGAFGCTLVSQLKIPLLSEILLGVK